LKLLVQPGDGVQPLIKGIRAAKKSIEVVIFRFDQREVERALSNAVSRGVAVTALIAHTNRAGEESLRKLEMRLLAAGVTVARTDDDLIRYHAKYMIVDRRELYLLAFNFTLLDIERSRSFGIITLNRNLVAEAAKLFEADTQRHPYESGLDNLVVSPVNARNRLTSLIKSAKKELNIYDLKVSDQPIMRLLEERAKAGVNVRIIGRATHKMAGVAVCKLAQTRLHTRTIIVDGRTAFIGSQSLRENELDARREVGVVFKDPKVVRQINQVFEEDWAHSRQNGTENTLDDKPVAKVAKKVAKAVTRELPDVVPVLHDVVKEVVGDKMDLSLKPEKVEDTVKVAILDAIEEALREVVQEAVGPSGDKANGATK
jgi:phosphatidylserine/phosphatidylglycerophosphate/cardiolipin synthase-like enzyme